MTAVTQTSNSEGLDVDGCVALYIELRNEKARLKTELNKTLEPYNKGMLDLETVMLKHLGDIKAKSIATVHGTVYQRVERSATIKDKQAFKDFILGSGQFDMLDWRANKVAVFDHIEKTKSDVPGVNTSAHMTIGVLSPNASATAQEE